MSHHNIENAQNLYLITPQAKEGALQWWQVCEKQNIQKRLEDSPPARIPISACLHPT